MPTPIIHPFLESLSSRVVAAGSQTMSPDWEIPPRTLEVHDLIAVESGSGTVQVGAGTYPLRPGTWAVLPAGVPHQAGQDSRHPLTLSVVHFSLQPEDSPNLLHQIRDPGRLPCPDPRQAAHFLNLIIEQFNRDDPPGQLLANRALDLLLALLLHQIAADSVTDSRVARALALIQSEYNSKWTSASLGRRVGLSPDHFRECFIDALGVSPHHYLASIRLHHARRLLRHSRLTLQEIAQATGWENASTFARTFKKQTGQTPGAYRQIARRGLW